MPKPHHTGVTHDSSPALSTFSDTAQIYRRPGPGILGAALNDGAEDMRDEARALCEPSVQ